MSKENWYQVLGWHDAVIKVLLLLYEKLVKFLFTIVQYSAKIKPNVQNNLFWMHRLKMKLC